MVGNGAPRKHPQPPTDGWVGTNGDNHPKSHVPSSTSHTASPPGFGKIWTPVMDVPSTPSPVYEGATTPFHGGTQHTHGPAFPNHTILPTHESRGSTPISIIPTPATNSPSPSGTTITTTLSHRSSEQGQHHGTILSPRVQCGPGEHARKIRDAKDKGIPHAGTPGDRVQRAVRRNAYCSVPQKTHKLQTRSLCTLISKLKKCSSVSGPSGGHHEPNPSGQGEGNQKERSNQKPLLMNFIIWNARGPIVQSTVGTTHLW
ncbi:hypothetical protein A4A49_33673 [Nicotiana attenuata]|uniref:Uncharacterized protein n=1 Tax=Nicotiana attenuata TaxID=49451 RepID=A0A1J6J8G5_NICAT|nr:hypothetical protein A4A49_33673 [Nicotiana attenuata]